MWQVTAVLISGNSVYDNYKSTKAFNCSLYFSATSSEEGAAIDDKELLEFHCDACSNDTTNTVRIRCADRNCPDFDLCVICFYRGAEPVKYKVWHDYWIVKPQKFPNFSEN